MSLGGHRSPAKQCLSFRRYRSVRSSTLSSTLGMASRRARQRLKGGGGDAGPAAEKRRELLGSRETGTEPRPECVCGRRAWPAGGSGGPRGLCSPPPGSAPQWGSVGPRRGSAVRRASPQRALLLPVLGASELPSVLAPPQVPASLELGSAMLQVQAHVSRLRAGRVSRASVRAVGRGVHL